MLQQPGRLPLKRIYRDTFLRKNPDGHTPDVMNMVITRKTGVYGTEKGNEVLSTFAVDNNLTIIGVKDILYGKKIFMSITQDNLSEIGILDADNNYTAKVHEDLGFSINHPFAPQNLQVEYNYKGEIILSFTDNYNSPKIVNLDSPPNPFNLDAISLFPSFTNINIESDIVENGGSLLSGTYYPVFRYVNNDGTTTAYSAIGNPVYIVPSSGTDFNSYEGSVAGSATLKSIKFTLTNVDTNYDRVELAIIYKKDGSYSTYVVNQANTGSTVTIYYTGSEQTIDSEIASIIVPPAFYNRIGHFTQVQGTLYSADVGESDPINLQKYANLITLKFKSELLSVIDLNQSYKLNDQNNKKKCYTHQEVYDFYVHAKLKKGGFTEAYHIPGRAATTIQGTISGNENDFNTDLVGQDSTLSTDIAISGTSRYFQTRDTTRDLDNGTFTGTFGLWENDSEFYPNTDDYNSSDVGGEDLRGKKVRHHRFPSIKKCKDSFYSSDGEYGKSKLDALSVVIDSFPTIPSEILDQIEEFQLLYAKRDYSNLTVAGNDISLVGGYRNGDSSTSEPDRKVYSAGGNWSNTQTDASPSDLVKTSKEFIIPNKNTLRLHSFNLLLNKPAIKPSYLSNHLVLNYGNIQGHIIKQIGDCYAFHLDYTDTTDATTSNLSNADELIFAIKDYKYEPANVLDGKIENYRSEAFISARITNGNNRLLYGTNGMQLQAGNTGSSNLNNESLYFSSIMMYRTDVYTSFYSQNLASTGTFFTPTSIPDSIYGGDTFLCLYGFVTFAPRTLRDVPGSAFPVSSPIADSTAVKVVRAHICECTDNIGFRYEVTGDDQTKYYPKEQVGANIGWIIDETVMLDPNKIQYNKDYSSVNDLNPYTTFSPFNVFINQHPWRVIRATVNNTDSTKTSWRTYLANDYFELRRDKGKITNIEGIGDDLLINLETSILRTRASSTLKTSSEEAFVGSGDIFARPPIELMTDDKGTGGCQNKFSCILTPDGYFFVDVDARKIFVVQDQLKEITYGLYNYFLDNLRTTGDNPFNNTGITVAWDKDYKRLILSQLDINPFVWSYTPDKEGWTSRHSYQPGYLFNDRNNFYTVKDNIVYNFNANNRAKYFGTIYPSWMVYIFRDLPPKRDPYETRDAQASGLNNLFGAVTWRTEVYLNNIKQRDLTINQILLWNSYQSSSNIDIVPFNNSLDEEYNTRRRKDEWTFNSYRDLVEANTQEFIDDYQSVEANINRDKDFTLKKRMCDDFLAVKFLFSNEIISTLQPENYLIDADVATQKVNR